MDDLQKDLQRFYCRCAPDNQRAQCIQSVFDSEASRAYLRSDLRLWIDRSNGIARSQARILTNEINKLS